MSLSHKLPDRIPSIIDARKEVKAKLIKHFKVNEFNEVLSILGADDMYHFQNNSLLKIDFPEFDEKAEVIDGVWSGGGNKYIRIDDRTFQNEWGVVRRIGSDGKYIEWITGPFVDKTMFKKSNFPTISQIVDDPDLPIRIKQWKEKGVLVRAIYSQPFKIAWMLRGMENLLMDYALDPQFVEDLYDKIFSIQSEMLFRCTKAGVDVIGFDGDIASKDNIIMGPERWRKIDKPRLSALISRCKKENPNVYAFIHSDGNIRDIIPDLIEIGFDIIDPIQPECMDPYEIKKVFGKKITLHRCGSLQKTLPFGTPEDCKKEAVNLIRGCGYDGGLVLGASNTIGWDVPIENIVTWYATVRDFDLSKL